MARIKELREKMANIATEARSKLSEITDETPEARAAEIESEFDRMMDEHDRLERELNRLLRIEKAERSAADFVDTTRRPGNEPGQTRGGEEPEVVEYRDAFYQMVAAGGDLNVMSNEARQALREHRMQVTGTDSAGGYFVPTELAAFIEKSMIYSGPMMTSDLFTVINSNSGNPFEIPTVDDTTVTAEAHTEGTAPTDDGGKDVTIGQKTLGAYASNTEWVKFSRELAMDSAFAVERLLGELLGERLGRWCNGKLTTGSGSSDVEGIVTNAAAATAAAATNAITADEVIELVHSVDMAYRNSPGTAFMMHDTTLKALRKLKDGDGNYLWQMGNFQAGVPGSILGYNFAVNNDMAHVGSGASSKVMLFGDMKKYYVRKVGSPILFVANERFAPDYGVLGYQRIDGVLTNTAAVKHLPLAAS